MHSRLAILASVAAFATAEAPVTAHAQLVDLHGSFSSSTLSHTRSTGGGVSLHLPTSFGPGSLWLSVGADYLNEQKTTSRVGGASVELSLMSGQPFLLGFLPYAGGGLSVNWSGGDPQRWDGSRRGLEALGGLRREIDLGPLIGLQLEQRFGYVEGNEHTLTTRLGLLIAF